jgi:hypothetical protein
MQSSRAARYVRAALVNGAEVEVTVAEAEGRAV